MRFGGGVSTKILRPSGDKGEYDGETHRPTGIPDATHWVLFPNENRQFLF
jgi:hypothetical protein